jgi:hypothetical protein
MATLSSPHFGEDAIERLVEEAISRPSAAALHIMMVNFNSLPLLSLFPDRKCLALIEVKGQNEDSLKALTRAKSKLATVFLEKFGKILSQVQAAANIPQLFGGKAMQDFLRNLSPDMLQQITKYQMNQISLVDREIIEAIVGIFIDSGIAIAKNYPESFDMSQIVKDLMSLRLIKPEFMISLCHKCGNYQFMMSAYAMGDDKCGFCSEPHLLVRIYVFDEYFNELKLQNLDLPLFIKRYIEKMSAGILQAEVSRKINHGEKGEFDVFIDKTKLGIECKVLLHPNVPGTKLDSTAGELLDQLSRYSEAGARRAIVVTNLDEKDSGRVEAKVTETLLQKGIVFEHLRFCYRSFDDLLGSLNEEIRLGTIGGKMEPR